MIKYKPNDLKTENNVSLHTKNIFEDVELEPKGTVKESLTVQAAMKIELSTSESVDILLKDEYAKWSRNAAYALIEYYESLEEEMGESIEIDTVAIRRDWDEYKSVEEAIKDYDVDFSSSPNPSEAALEYLWPAQYIPFNGGILIQQFQATNRHK